MDFANLWFPQRFPQIDNILKILVFFVSVPSLN